jgi:hypothetical protein
MRGTCSYFVADSATYTKNWCLCIWLTLLDPCLITVVYFDLSLVRAFLDTGGLKLQQLSIALKARTLVETNLPIDLIGTKLE